MKEKFTISLLLLTLILPIQAQENNLLITTNQKSDNSVEFRFSKSSYGSFFLTVNLENLQNARRSGYRGVVKGGSGNLFTLKPVNPNQGIGYSYRYSSIRGNPKVKLDTRFEYLLPFQEGTVVTAHEMSNLGAKHFDSKTPINWKAYMFATTNIDTVVAARKGLVVEIVNKHVADTLNDYGYHDNTNYVLIEHKDGTLAKYEGLEINSIVVKEGQKTFPNQALGVIGRYDRSKIRQLRFSIYYLSRLSNPNQGKETLSNRVNWYSYVSPIFYTKTDLERLVSGRKYVAAIKDEVLYKEFTKRELKKFKSK